MQFDLNFGSSPLTSTSGVRAESMVDMATVNLSSALS